MRRQPRVGDMLRHIGVVLAAAVSAVVVLGTLGQADDGEAFIVTELHPGWNLIGWVQEPTPVDELFDSVAELDRIAVYDSASGTWSEKARAEQSEGQWTLRSGRAYWLHVSGERAIEWMRERGSYSNDIELKSGSNFVAWRALDRVPAAVGLRQIRNSTVAAGRWDAAKQQWRLAPVLLPFSYWSLSEFNHGDGVWIKAIEDVTWRQLTGESPSVTFIGPVTDQQRVDTLAELEAYRELFAVTFGGVVSGAAVVVFSDNGVSAKWSSEASGTAHSCGWARGWEAYYSISCGKSTLAHEYFHLLQNAASEWGRLAVPPDWMTEGGAVYATLLSSSVVGGPGFADQMSTVWRGSQADGRGLSTAGEAGDHHQYQTGAAAIHLLMQSNQAEELLLYERLLSSAPPGVHHHAYGADAYSRTAFEELFGVSIPALETRLYGPAPSFESTNAQATALQTQEPPLRLQLEIEAPDGNRIEGTATISLFAPATDSHFAVLALGGSISVPIVTGRYKVQAVDVGGGCQVGFEAPLIVVEDRFDNSYTTVRLKATGCEAVVSGTVLGRDGQPLQPRARGVWVELYAESEDGLHRSPPTRVEPDQRGRFQATVAPGRYAIGVSPIETGGAVFGWVTEEGLSLDRTRRSILDLRSDPEQEVTVRLPLSRTIRVSGVVHEPNGRPAESLTIFVEGSSWGYLRPWTEGMSRGYIGWRQRTDSRGRFDLPFAGQNAVIVVLNEHDCHLGWYGPGGFTTDLSEISYWATEDRDIRNLRIHLPRTACE